MSLTAYVYKNRSLSKDELATIGSVDVETGQPERRDGTSYNELFAAKEIFLGNGIVLGSLRRELELTVPTMSECIRRVVLPTPILSGETIGDPDVSRIASECSDLLAEGRFELSESLRTFLVNLEDLAKTALYENNPIVLY